jgi:formylglycine-generating enzyme required for sulfatase activity
MPQTPAKQFSGIFISYRREDAAAHAGRLSDKLREYFGKDEIFMDIDNIQPGEDFVEVIEQAVGACEILIAVIGRSWLSENDQNTGRLSNPNDFVRLEIATALNRNIRVIPVLVERATMPRPQDLPEDLSKLSRRNAIELSDIRWQRDVDQLIDAIVEIRRKLGVVQPLKPEAPPKPQPETKPEPKPLPQPDPPPRPLLENWKWLTGGAGLVVVMLIAVVWFIQRAGSPTKPPASEISKIATATNEPAKKPESHDGMVYVPGGEFIMGRDDGDEYERPAHRETVKAFFIDSHEVTCGDYEKFVKEDSHPAPQGWPGRVCPAGEARKPVTGVTWGDAVAFCYARSKRLPTEQEWEFAARGTDGRRYPWGNDWHAGRANADGASGGMVDVGSYPGGKSPFGAFDMTGNAWEWTAADMTAYPGGKLPEDPKSGTKVLRGGSYLSNRIQAAATYRHGWLASGANSYSEAGFRCVKDAPESSSQK